MSTDSTKNSVGAKIGKYLKYQREKRSLSLQEISHLVDLTPSFLNRLENGVYQTIKFDVIEKIANGLNMSITDLLKKCELTSTKADLPTLRFYLKEKYQLTTEAIDDVELFIEFVKKKYFDDIKKNKEMHQEYWESNE